MATFNELVSIYTNQSQMGNFFTDKMGILSVLSYAGSSTVYDGVTDASSAIDDLIDDLPDAGAIIFFPSTSNGSTYKISDDITFPADATLWFADGAKLSVDSGKTVTINGNIQAGLQQIFSGSGTISGSIKNKELYPQWWGAAGDGSNDDTTAIQAAINCLEADSQETSGGIIFFTKGRYSITSTLTVDRKNMFFVGSGRESSIIQYSGSDGTYAISIDGNQPASGMLAHFGFENLAIRDMANAGAGTLTKHGIYCKHVQCSTFKNVDIKGFNYGVVLCGNSHLNTFLNCYIRGNLVGVLGNTESGGANHNSFVGCWFGYNTTNSFDGTYVNGTSFVACDFEPANGTLILNDRNTLLGCRVERNTNGTIFISITGDYNDIKNILVAASGGYNAGTIFDISGNYNKITGSGKAGGNIANITGDHNKLYFAGGVLDGNSANARIVNTGFGNVLESPWGYVSTDRTINVINASLKNEILQSNDLSDASWTKVGCTIGGLHQIVVDAGPPASHSVSQSFVADRDFTAVWVGLKHLKGTASGRYLTVTVTNVTAGTSDNTLYIDNNGASYAHYFRCSDIGGSSGDTVTISMSTSNLAGNSCYVKEVMVSLDYPAPYTQTLDANAVSGFEYPAVEFTWDPGNLADGVGETVSVSVPGAVLGDFVIVSAPYDLQDCTVTGYVQATDTVEVRLQNESTGARDLASGTWRVKILKP
jgi:hypothetical protein